MTAKLEKLDGLARQINFIVPADQVDPKIESKLNEIAPKVNLHGFRAGKVPFSIVKKRFGKDMRLEVISEIIKEHYEKTVTAENLQPAGMPKIDIKMNEVGKDLEFSAQFEIFPEIKLADMAKVKIEKLQAEVSDSDVDQMLEKVRKQHATWASVDRAAKEGDRLTIDFEGSIKGEKFEGGSAKDFKLELGSGRMIPGFETELLKAKPDSEVKISVKFPKDYHAKDLAGQPATFEVKVHRVEEAKLPELDAEFIKKLGVETGDLVKLKAEIKTNMQHELTEQLRFKFKEAVLDRLIEMNQIEVPKALVHEEIHALKHQANERFTKMLGGKKINLPELPDEHFAKDATKRVTLSLLLGAVVKAHDLTVDHQKVEARLKELAAVYQYPEQLIAYYKADKSRLAPIQSLILEEQAVEKICEQLNIKDKPTTYDEVMNANKKEQ